MMYSKEPPTWEDVIPYKRYWEELKKEVEKDIKEYNRFLSKSVKGKAYGTASYTVVAIETTKHIIEKMKELEEEGKNE